MQEIFKLKKYRNKNFCKQKIDIFREKINVTWMNL